MIIKQLNKYGNGYPEAFTHLSDAPSTIYQLGSIAQTTTPKLSIVGSRRPSNYGKQITYNLAHFVAQQGITIVSGLALGIDSIAHRAALDAKGSTVAVMPCGLDQIYPARHRDLAKCILINNGALISEYPTGTPARKEHFIARNRLVSALGDGLLITEATAKSGTSSTAQFALEQGKTVMVVPGNITSPLSEGTNSLLRLGAVPILRPEDVLHALGYTIKKPQALLRGDTEDEQRIIDALGSGAASTNVLQDMCNLSLKSLQATLTNLEINGIIKQVDTQIWSL